MPEKTSRRSRSSEGSPLDSSSKRGRGRWRLSPSTMAQVVVLSEIYRPPLALREPGAAPPR